jgi:hypothetical protein
MKQIGSHCFFLGIAGLDRAAMVNTEAGVLPGEQQFNSGRWDLVEGQKPLQYFVPKEYLQLPGIGMGQRVEDAWVVENPVCGQQVQVGVVVAGASVGLGTRCAAHAGKAAVQVAAIQVLIDDLANDGPPEAIVPRIDIIINLLEVVKMILDQGIQR